MKGIIDQINIGFNNMLKCLKYLFKVMIIVGALIIISYYIFVPIITYGFLSFIVWLGAQA